MFGSSLKRSGKGSAPYFTEDFMESLRVWLSEREGVTMQINHSSNMFMETFELWEEEQVTHLYVRVFNHERLIIKVASLRNTRQGTFTELVRKLCAQVHGTSVTRLVVESVLTAEMRSWCFKNKLSVSPSAPCTDDGLCVDYVGSLLSSS